MINSSNISLSYTTGNFIFGGGGAFFNKCLKSSYQALTSLSVPPHGTTRLPLVGFS